MDRFKQPTALPDFIRNPAASRQAEQRSDEPGRISQFQALLQHVQSIQGR